jgi:glycyl-tRNA synthetase
MDEAGTPYGVTVDGETSANQTVTVRHRDTMQQDRIAVSQVAEYLKQKMRSAA